MGMVFGNNLEYFNNILSKVRVSSLSGLLLISLMVSILEIEYKYYTYNISIYELSHFLRPIVLIYSVIFTLCIYKVTYKYDHFFKNSFFGTCLANIGSLSYGIFLSHPFFQGVYILLFFEHFNVSYNSMYAQIIMFFFVLLGSYTMTYICTKHRIGIFLVGKGR